MTTGPASCPSCAARLPAGAQWCSLCFCDLRPEPAPPVLREPEPVAAAVRGAALPGPGHGGAPLEGPGTASGAVALQLPFDDDPALSNQSPGDALPVDVDRTVEAMLARLAAEESRDPLSSLGSAGVLLRGRNSRIAVILIGTLLLAGLALAAMAILGALTS